MACKGDKCSQTAGAMPVPVDVMGLFGLITDLVLMAGPFTSDTRKPVSIQVDPHKSVTIHFGPDGAYTFALPVTTAKQRAELAAEFVHAAAQLMAPEATKPESAQLDLPFTS